MEERRRRRKQGEKGKEKRERERIRKEKEDRPKGDKGEDIIYNPQPAGKRIARMEVLLYGPQEISKGFTLARLLGTGNSSSLTSKAPL